MIQRAQSIYLLLAFLCMVMLLFFPLFSVTTTYESVSITGVFDSHGFAVENLPTVDADGMTYDKSEGIDIPVWGVIISLSLLTAASLMMYKKRKRQLMLCRLNFIFHIIIVIAFYSFFYLGQPLFTEAMQAQTSGDVEVTFNMETGFFLLIPTIPFLFLAIRGIKNDEKLLQSIDRIR